MNKKILLPLFVLALLLLFFFLPYRPVPSPEKVQSIRIEYQKEWLEDFDEEEVLRLLSQLRCQRRLGTQATSLGVVEINLLYDGQPLHIILGEHNLCYRSGDDLLQGTILDPAPLLSQLEQLLLP